MIRVVIAATVAVGSLALASGASAFTTCKSTPAVTMALSDSSAENAWRSQVTNTYGAAWANFNIAKDKKYSEVNLVVVMHQLSARPCAVVSTRAVKSITKAMTKQH